MKVSRTGLYFNCLWIRLPSEFAVYNIEWGVIYTGPEVQVVCNFMGGLIVPNLDPSAFDNDYSFVVNTIRMSIILSINLRNSMIPSDMKLVKIGRKGSWHFPLKYPVNWITCGVDELQRTFHVSRFRIIIRSIRKKSVSQIFSPLTSCSLNWLKLNDNSREIDLNDANCRG